MSFIQSFNIQTIVILITAIGAFATIVMLGMPLFSNDKLDARMRSVADERERLRVRRMQDLKEEEQRGQLRQNSRNFLERIVSILGVRKLFNRDNLPGKLKMAGLRGPGPLTMFFVARTVTPFAFLAVTALYLFFVNDFGYEENILYLIIAASGVVGFYAPDIYLTNRIQKRQESIRMAFPDAMDLLLICVQSGMSIEAALRKVATEISTQSSELAEEFTLTNAEMSYLLNRRQAYENLGLRTGLAGVRAVTTSLIQAERYGTPLGQALRAMA